MRRPRRDGARRGAGRRRVLRRRRGGRGRAHRADGRDLRGALEALHDPGARLRAARPVGIDARLVVELGIDAADHHRRAARVVAAPARSAPGVAHQPLEPFRAALEGLAAELDGAGAGIGGERRVRRDERPLRAAGGVSRAPGRGVRTRTRPLATPPVNDSRPRARGSGRPCSGSRSSSSRRSRCSLPPSRRPRPTSSPPPTASTRGASSPRVRGRTRWAPRRAATRRPGFHTRGEMGGFWTPPIKLLDGIWFGVDGTWLGPATQYTSGWGYLRMALRHSAGVSVEPHRLRARRSRAPGSSACTSRPPAPSRRSTSPCDAHSELMNVLPLGRDDAEASLPDDVQPARHGAASADGNALRLPRAGHAAGARRRGARLRRRRRLHVAADPAHPAQTGAGIRGPQEPAVICPAVRPGRPAAARPLRRHGVRQGHRRPAELRRRRARPAARRRSGSRVAGSRPRRSPTARRRRRRTALADPAGAAARASSPQRAALAAHTRRRPARRPAARTQASTWSKQNLAESVQEARDLQVRVTNAGKNYPAPVGHGRQGALDRRRLAGLPVAVRDRRRVHRLRGRRASASSRAIEDHLRGAARRQRGRQRHERQGRARGDATTARSTSARNSDAGQHRRDGEVPERRRAGVALDRRRRVPRRDVRLRACATCSYIFRELDADDDGWPEGLGNVERDGHGRGEARQHRLHDPRPARPRRPGGHQGRHAPRRAGRTAQGRATCERRFDGAWWFGATAQQYADSLDDPGNNQGLPAALDRRDAGRGRAHAARRPADAGLARRRPRRRARRAARAALLHAATSACSTPAPAGLRRRQRSTCDRVPAGRAADVHAEHRRSWRSPRALGRLAPTSSSATRPATRRCSSTRP